MPALSVFQILPPHVVCTIVNHVSGCSRMYYNGVEKGTIEYYQLQKPLLWVCHNFRAAVLSNFGHAFILRVHRYDQFVLPSWYSPSLAISQADSSLFHLAKELVVQLDMWSLCADSGLEFLSLDIYEDGAFPHVRSVKFVFGDYCASENGSSFRPNALANASAFVERILRMAPRASEIEMVTDVDFDDDYDVIFDDFSDRSSDRSSDHGQTCHSDMLAQVFQLATRVSHRHSGFDIILNQEMSLVRNLVHLNFQISDGGGANFVLLAQQCAATLQSLSVELFDYEESISFIRDRNGNYVRYPQLLLLEHTVGNFSVADELPVSSAVIPFPRLKSLSFGYFYPFGDDTPFRGNAATLERLSLTLNHVALETLRRHQLFTPTSHPALRYADIYLDDGGLERTTSWTDLVKFSLSIGPCAPMRKIGFYGRVDSEWIHALPTFDQHQNIQVLELPGANLTLHGSIVLVSSLPLLSDVYASEPCLGEELAGVDLGQLAAYFASKQLPAGLESLLPHGFIASVSGSWGERFRFWRIIEIDQASSAEAVHCMLLLALLCPNFDFAASHKHEHRLFIDALEGAINTDAFRPYPTRLRRLLFTR